MKFPQTQKEMLIAMAKRSGGVPDFAKKILHEKGGVSKKDLNEADRIGKRTRQPTTKKVD